MSKKTNQNKLDFKKFKKASEYSLRKNYVITVLVSLIGLVFLSLYSNTSSSLVKGLECVHNYFGDAHKFATNATIYYDDSNYEEITKQLDDSYLELYKKSDVELNELGFNDYAIKYIRAISPEKSEEIDLAKRLKVRDGFAKPLLGLASNDTKILADNFEDILLNVYTIKNFNNDSETPNGQFTIVNDSYKAIIYSVIAIMISIAYRFLFVNVIHVGYARFFLENSKYHKTRLGRILKAFKEGYFKTVKTMARKTLYKTFWNFTIIGGIIKNYSYKLVPFIVAEDSEIKSRDALTLSRKLMNGYKWKAFSLDFSFIFWHIVNAFSLGFVGLFFLDPYVEGTSAEFYKEIINRRKDEEFYKNYLNGREYIDKDLYVEDDKDFYPGSEPKDISIANQEYTPLTLFNLFFLFAFVGWCMEVLLFLLKTHTFVNRGTLIGPWLPIYGLGCVLILAVFTKTGLKKHLNNPLILFINIMILCGILEYTASWYLEVSTGLKYWDYAGHFLNINGRICLENLCEFGLGGLLCIYLFGPKLNEVIKKVHQTILIPITSVLLILFIMDNVYVKMHPRTGYGITDAIIDENGNLIEKTND